MALSIAPRTDGELRLTVFEGDSPVDSATVTASVWSPSGTQQATNVSCTSVGGSSGAYILAWQHSWTTDDADKAITGEFLVEVKAAYAGQAGVRRLRVVVQFDDTD